jgi:hypothetical protein
MPTRWRSIDSDDKVTIAYAVKETIARFWLLGADARESCEARRIWLLEEVRKRVTYLDPCRMQMNVTWEQAADQLAVPFAPFNLPENLTAEFVETPLLPNCPMTHYNGTISICADFIDSATLRARNISMTVEQLVLHEMIHAWGDTNRDDDTDVRINWAGVGALYRQIRKLPYAEIDALPVRGE